MKKPFKIVLRIVLAVVVVAVVAVAVAWLMADRLVKTGIQTGGTYALGVPTDVQDVNLSLLKGTLKIDTLNVANPDGYKTPHLMKTGVFNLEVAPGSVPSDTVLVRKCELDGLDVNIESKDGKDNISVVLDNLKKLSPAEAKSQGSPEANPQGTPEAKPQASPEAKSGKKVKIERLVISNVTATFGPIVGGKGNLHVRVPKIELQNIGADGSGVSVPELIAQLIPAILASILDTGKDIIPAEWAGKLNTQVADTVKALGGQAGKVLQQTGGAAAKVVADAAETAGKTAGGLGKGLGDGLKGLLPAKK